jgi:hypothetical protein
MSLPKNDAEVLSARWAEGVLLKRDVFSTVERGRFRSDGGEVDAVLRRLDQVPWWSFGLARHLFARERKALMRAKGLNVGPELLWAAWRYLLLPLGQGGAAPAASCRHLPQRSRQGAELAAGRRREMLSDRFSARCMLQYAQPFVPYRSL